MCNYENCRKENTIGMYWEVDFEALREGGIGNEDYYDVSKDKIYSCDEHFLILGLSKNELPDIVEDDRGRNISLESELEKHKKLIQEISN